ncbi:MAG: glycosyltransferase [Hyphomicrobiaceae bacterium]|nr:glycosyltransferase [Hyphomicrobiaceae bacterium]
MLVCDQAYLPAAQFVASQIAAQQVRTYDLVLVLTDSDVSSLATAHGIATIGAKSAIDAALPPHCRSSAALARLLVARLLPARYTRILYLDCDVWVATPELHRIFDIDLGGRPLAAARDSFEIFSRHDRRFLQHKAAIGMSPAALYFNSGVMLIDRAQWVAERIEERALAYVATAGRLDHQDQTALNAVIDGRWKELSPRWNWAHATRERTTRAFTPHIMHFMGPSKPWDDVRARYPARYGEAMRRFFAGAGADGFFRPTPPAARLSRHVYTCLKALRGLVHDRREQAIRDLMRQHGRAEPSPGEPLREVRDGAASMSATG